MTFFRIKKIKGKEYAYIVENEWKNKSSRQKVKGYIGRAYRFNLLNETSFVEHAKIENVQNYVENNEKGRIIKDLVEWEIFRFGISKEAFLIDLQNSKIQKDNKDVSFMINDGFMCSLTLKSLLEFKPDGDEQADGYKLARAFVEAGIKVPQDIFVALFGKVYNKAG